MKVLVFGAGVIGGQLAHALIACGNDVTVIARGAWAETLQTKGLRIHHYIQRKDTTDHPRVLEAPGEDRYDIVFAVMQYRQMEKILPELARVNSPIVVLTGNNLSASEMEARILEDTPTPKTVLFGFGSTAGTRENGRLTTVHTGDGRLTLGKAHEDIPETAETLEGNALQKARYVKEHYGLDCFADDTGLEVRALDGAPGVHTARYAELFGAGDTHDSNANMNLLLRNLENKSDRHARFRTVIALI